MAERKRAAVPPDYDSNPARSGIDLSPYRLQGDVHPDVARRFEAEGLSPILDIGSGRGELRKHLSGPTVWIGLDRSTTQLAESPPPVVLGDAAALPFRDESFEAVAALWMLYHLEDPIRALTEAHRVLRYGGLLAACTTRRDDSPEFARWEQTQPTTFDGEEAPDLVGQVFSEVEVVSWDARLIRLPTRDAVRDYLLARGASPDVAEDAARSVHAPIEVTKRGVSVYGRKR